MTLIQANAHPAPRVLDHPHLSVSVATATRGTAARWSPAATNARLKPLRLHWAADGELSTLTLRWVGGRAPGSSPVDGATDGVPRNGDQITLSDGDGRTGWFVGHVAQCSQLLQSDPDRETAELTAYGPELRLRNLAVHGQWHKRPAVDDRQLSGDLDAEDAVAANTFTSDLPTVFNRDGRPNASSAELPWRLCVDGASLAPGGRVFEATGRAGAEYWTAATALRSLVERLDGYATISPRTDWRAIDALLGSVALNECRVEGVDLLEAISRILQPCGFGFCLEPWSDGAAYADGRSRHLLRVFPRTGSDPAMPEPILGGDRAQVRRLEVLRDAHNTVNQVRVIGALKRIDVALDYDPADADCELRPAWDTAAHDLDDYAVGDSVPEMDALPVEAAVDAWGFRRRYGRGGDLNGECFDVFRTFVWNEDGSLGALGVDPADLSPLLGESYLRRPRPVGPSTDPADTDTQRPARVLLGIVGDDDAWIELPQTEVLEDRAGFTIHIPHLDRYYPYAEASQTLRQAYCTAPGRWSLASLLMNALAGATTQPAARFRLIGSIEADEALAATAVRSRADTWPMAVERVIYSPRRYRLRRTCEGETVRDDTTDAQRRADELRAALSSTMCHGSLLLSGLQRAYAPGAALRSTRGRAVPLTDGEPGSSVRVRAITWSFAEGAVRTELLLESPALELCQ